MVCGYSCKAVIYIELDQERKLLMAHHASPSPGDADASSACFERYESDCGGGLMPQTPVIKPIGRRKQGEGRNNLDSVESDVFGSVSSPGFRFEFRKEPLFHELPPRLREPSIFERLPDEVVLRHIFCKLDSATLARCSCVCTQMRRWSDNGRLWKLLCQQRWGVNFVNRCVADGKAERASSTSWKMHFVERTRQHRLAVADSGLSLARLSLEDEKKAKIESAIKRPVRSQLEAACVYMPRSNEDASTMAMARSKGGPDPVAWSDDAPRQENRASVKKSRRGRRGRSTKTADIRADPSATIKAGSSPGCDVDESPVLRHRTSTQPADTKLVGRLAPSPPNGPAGRRSPPFGRRPSGSDSGADATVQVGQASSRGYQMKSASSATQRQKQPTPPPSAYNPRRRELNLRAVSGNGNGDDASPPPAPRSSRARSFSPSSLYSGCVTPTRMFNVHGDSSSDEDDDHNKDDIEADNNYSSLCHPVYEEAAGSNTTAAPGQNWAVVENASYTHALTAGGQQMSAGSFSEGVHTAGSISVASPPCPWHSEALDQYCLQCRTLVCGRCCLFGHHSGHPRVPASEAYSRCRDEMLGSKDQLAQLAQKVSSCESRMKAERDRVAKERSAMKKSLRHGIKGLRDLLNQKQNELMEMVRLEEETKLTHVAKVGQQLNGLRKELADGVKAADAIQMVKEDCPLLIESSNALEDRTKAVAGVLDKLDKDIAVLPQLAAFQFKLHDQAVRGNIESLGFAKVE